MKIIIFDNNELSLNKTHSITRKLLEIKNIQNNINCLSDEISFLNYIYDTSNIDIAILNIGLDNNKTMDLAKILYLEHPFTKIIFIGESTLYIEKIFEVSPLYFLLKPLDIKKLWLALNKAIKAINNTNSDQMILSIRGAIYSIRKNLIEYIESNKRILTIYKPNKTFRLYGKMDDIEPKLGNNFIRCHQSFIVNMEKIKSIEKLEISLHSGKKIPISKSRYSNVKYILFNYFG